MAVALTQLDEKTLYSLIMSDDITYEGVIRDIIKQQGLNPWELDLDKLISEYLVFIKKIEKLDFRICGKFILTAAILLKMKSDNLVLKEEKQTIDNRDLEFDKELVRKLRAQFGLLNVEDVFTPKMPLAKKRIATIDDLMSALKQAIEVKERRVEREKKRDVKKPEIHVKKVDLFSKIKDVLEKVKDYFVKKEKVYFKEMIASDDKKDYIWTFIPLLHLANQGQVQLDQEKEFEDILIIKGVKYGEKLVREDEAEEND